MKDVDKHSRDIARPKWQGGKRESSYSENYDQIRWNKETKFAKRGKAKKNMATEALYIKELVNACRTPVWERKGDKGEKTFREVS